MCGLVGFINFEKKDVAGLGELLTTLLYLDVARGEDATGVAALMNDNTRSQWMHYKRAIAGYDYIHSKPYAQIYKNVNDFKAVIGHNRKATMGNSGLDGNAHPFHHGNIILAHNGTLRWLHQLLPEYKTKHNIDTDSEALTFLFNRDGIQKTISRTEGAFALTWFNMKDGTTNFLRNDERPLHLAKVKGKNMLVWASEERMLMYALGCVKMEVEWSEELPVGKHYCIKDDVDQIAIDDIKFKPETKTYTHSNNRNNQQYPRTSNIMNPSAEQKELRKKLSIPENYKVSFTYLDYIENKYSMRHEGTLLGIPTRNKLSNCTVEAYNFNPNNFNMAKGFSGIVHRIKEDDDGDFTLIVGHLKNDMSTDDPAGAKDFKEHQKRTKAKAKKQPKQQRIALPAPQESPEEGHSTETYAGHTVKPGPKSKNKKYRGPHNKFFRRRCMEKLLSDGCVYCSGPVFPDDHERVLWTHDDHVVCPDCCEQHNKGEINLAGYVSQ